MDTIESSGTFFQDGWSIYLITFLVLIALFFVQKYAFLLDRKLNRVSKTNSSWEGKPWPLLGALTLGFLTYLYDIFSPEKMNRNFFEWGWAEWLLVACLAILAGILAFESFNHFGKRFGLIRLLVLGLIAVGFYFAGLLAGLLLVTILALGLLFYFIGFWRKRLAIK